MQTTERMSALSEIVEYANEYLRVAEIGDWDNALNGLQIENSGRVTKIGAAVDVSTRVLSAAANAHVDLLLVHHGLFWPGLRPVSQALRRQLKLAFENDIALYNAHLAHALGLTNTHAFFEEKGSLIGVKAEMSIARDGLIRQLGKVLGAEPKTFLFGPEKTSAIGIITGGAGGEIYRVAEHKIDMFITGEAPHWAAVAAEELQMNLALGGHYATETFGVKALAAHLSKRFDLPFEFIDCPTGL